MKKTIKKDVLDLKKIQASTVQEVLEYTASSFSGIQLDDVDERMERFGRNEIYHKKHFSLLKDSIASFFNPFTLVLLLLAFISYLTDFVFVKSKDLTTVIIILIMVGCSGILRILQETKSHKAAEKLKSLVKSTTCIEREKSKKEYLMEEVVIGDIIHLAAGDFIPADLRILSAKDLFITQASLTGESEPIEKDFEQNSDNIAYMGSNVVSGSGIGIVVAVGNTTMFGKIADTLQTTKRTTSFDKGIKSVSNLLLRFMMVMVPVVFLLNGIMKHDFLQALLFALSIAVGLTPEMLPMIMTTTLAKGAGVMAKKKTVVKNLNAIQNFGAMDILCTDKTGTLTKDHIELEDHFNALGERDDKILRYAYANSHFQTGLKNLLDMAIIQRAEEEFGFQEISEKYKKVDEIPFDFQRRRMSVVIENQRGKSQLITKGAIEEMLQICSFVKIHGDVVALNHKIQESIMRQVEHLNHQGMRVLGLAKKTNVADAENFSVKDEQDMVFIGYLSFLDPAKESAGLAIAALHEHGVDVKVLTGDNELVAKNVCKQVGVPITHILSGMEMEKLNDVQLRERIKSTSLFAKLTPVQKKRIVELLKEEGHTVGFMGDGINDASAMKVSDIGISVDNAVDIAKESADIILLEKDLMVLEQGIMEGRRIFANMMKYMKMTVSSNFGNMISVLLASMFLPFLPMMPIQILILNLMYDISCIAIPWDKVDEEYLKMPRKWDATSIRAFMFWMGPISSIFDVCMFLTLYFVICPMMVHGSFTPNNSILFMAVFHAGWFVESLISQTLVMHVIRTDKVNIVKHHGSIVLVLITGISMIFGIILPFTFMGRALDMNSLPSMYFVYLMIIILLYLVLITYVKRKYCKRYGTLL